MIRTAPRPVKIQAEPLNLRILPITDSVKRNLKYVKTLDIFEKGTTHFHPEGLYAPEIFGNVGSKERYLNHALIDLGLPVLHPIVLSILDALRRNFYTGILMGQVHAVWSDDEQDFVKDSGPDARTGMYFFMEYWPKIKFKRNQSEQRNSMIDLIEEYRDISTYDAQILLPAGLREIEIKPNGTRVDNELNDVYRKMLMTSNVMFESRADPEKFDVPRWANQRAVKIHYDYIISILSGKRGSLQSKYGRRTTTDGTRNVLTAMDTSSKWMDDVNVPDIRHTEISFVQMLFGARPFTFRGLNNGPLSEIFPNEVANSEVWLINPTTLKRELIHVDVSDIDRYVGRDGKLNLMKRFLIKKERLKPLMLNDYYLALIYEDEHSFRVIYDIEELPAHLSRRNVTPMTLADLLYLSTYDEYQKHVGTITRYPVAGDGSIYPTEYIFTTTVKKYQKYELDANFERTDRVLVNFPDRTKKAVWLNALTLHLSRLVGAGADFDGDQGSSPIMYTEDSKQDVSDYYKRRKAFISVTGNFLASAECKTNKLVIANMTKDSRIETKHYLGEQNVQFNFSEFE